MATAIRIPDQDTLEQAHQFTEAFRRACRSRFPAIPPEWRSIIAKILGFEITQSETSRAEDMTSSLLDSDGLDMLNWRLKDHGTKACRRYLPHNWPTLDEDDVADFVTILRIQDNTSEIKDILSEAEWQLLCAPMGTNLLQQAALEHCRGMLYDLEPFTHTSMVVIQMGLMCSEQPRHTRRYTESFAGMPWQTRLAHYSQDQITEVDPSRLGVHTGQYATGFWVSVQGPDDWAVTNDRKGLMSTAVHHRVTVDDRAILAIASPRDLCSFIDGYIDNQLRVKWGELTGDYDGVVWIQDDPATAEALDRLRQIVGHEIPESNTGVIWNTSAITSVTPTTD